MQCVNTLDLSSSQVGAGSLPSLYYFPNYIDEAEEQRILKEVHASQAKWVQVRALLARGLHLHPSHPSNSMADACMHTKATSCCLQCNRHIDTPSTCML